MYSSHLVEKLKFGEKYVLANIVVVPLPKVSEAGGSQEHDLAARNKYLTRDVWQSFVYRKLYDLFRKHMPPNDKDGEKDSPFQVNQEYRLHCPERPYLQMKYEFRDKHFRNSLNMFFREKQTILHDSCIYVEISDQGRIIFDKVEDRDRTVMRLLKEIDELKTVSPNVAKTATSSHASKSHRSEYEEYRPEPMSKIGKKRVEEYVPLNRNGDSSGTKRTYKPSKIVDTIKSVVLTEPDPYTPGATDKPLKVSYIPSSSPLNKLEQTHTKHFKSGKVERQLFGSDDEYVPNDNNTDKTYPQHDSEKDMFADNECHSSARENGQGSGGESIASGVQRTFVAKREVLPRTSKQTSRALPPDSPEEKRRLKIARKNFVARSEVAEVDKIHSRLNNGLHRKAEQKKESSLRGQRKREKLPETAEQLPKVQVLDCTNLSKEEIIDTFERYRLELRAIYFRYKDHTERQWKNSTELCYFTDLANIMDDEQKLVMLHHLEEAFVPENDRGKYTEFFTSSLLMEWALRIFMERHRFENRQAALDRIKQQESSYLASLPNECLVKYQ